jgi:hypothetical protein
VKEKINFVEKIENPANLPEVRAIEDFWFMRIIGMQKTWLN